MTYSLIGSNSTKSVLHSDLHDEFKTQIEHDGFFGRAY